MINKILLCLATATWFAGPAFGNDESTLTPTPGYMIVIAEGVDLSKTREYSSAAIPILVKFGGKLLFTTRENANEIVEGGPFTQAVRVFQFPSLANARAFYSSEEYQSIIPLRAGNGELDIFFSKGFVLGPNWAPENQ